MAYGGGIMSVRELPPATVGVGWRSCISTFCRDVAAEGTVGFAEVIAERFPMRMSWWQRQRSPLARQLRRLGVPVVPHGVKLGLGDAGGVAANRVGRLADAARAVRAPLVSEHVSFVRALVDGEMTEAGHLLPVPRTEEALEVLCANVRFAQERLPVPLAVEPIATLVDPGGTMTEGEFLTELHQQTGVQLLVDVANVFANCFNRGLDPVAELQTWPVEAVAYCHVAGGMLRGPLYCDTHSHPMPTQVFELLAAWRGICQRRSVPVPPAMLERDGNYPTRNEFRGELQHTRQALFGRPAEVPLNPPMVPAPTQQLTEPASAPIGEHQSLADWQSQLLTTLLTDIDIPDQWGRQATEAARWQLRRKRKRLGMPALHTKPAEGERNLTKHADGGSGSAQAGPRPSLRAGRHKTVNPSPASPTSADAGSTDEKVNNTSSHQAHDTGTANGNGATGISGNRLDATDNATPPERASCNDSRDAAKGASCNTTPGGAGLTELDDHDRAFSPRMD